MRFKKSWLAILASSMLLAACTTSGTTPTSSVDGSASIVPASSSSVDLYDHTEIEPLSDINKNISTSSSGFLGDISVGMSLAHGSDYPIVFTLSNNPSGIVRVYSDNENVLTATSDTSGSNWILHTHKAGNAHLIIEDGDGIIHFRRAVPVKPKLDLEAAKKAIYSEDHWHTNEAFESFTGSMDLYFFENGTAYIDGDEAGGVSFNKLGFGYEYAPTFTETAEDLNHWFIFQITNWTEASVNCTYFALWETGDTLHFHTTQALLGIFNPAEAE